MLSISKPSINFSIFHSMINSKETLTLLLDHVYANVKKDVDVRYVTLDSLIYKTHDDVFV